jgi:hypothetical protein
MAVLFPGILEHNNSSYPITDTDNVKGGYMNVSNVGARDAIPSPKRKIGMLVGIGLTSIYKYNGADTSDTNWEDVDNWNIIGGVTSPGGSEGSIQVNDSGSFNGSSSLTYDNTTKELKLKGVSGGEEATLAFGGSKGSTFFAGFQEIQPGLGGEIKVFSFNRSILRLSSYGPYVGGEIESTFISSPVLADISSPPTNAEIEANIPTKHISTGVPTGYAGAFYYLQDTNTDVVYLCYAIEDSTWLYTALTAAL